MNESNAEVVLQLRGGFRFFEDEFARAFAAAMSRASKANMEEIRRQILFGNSSAPKPLGIIKVYGQ